MTLILHSRNPFQLHFIFRSVLISAFKDWKHKQIMCFMFQLFGTFRTDTDSFVIQLTHTKYNAKLAKSYFPNSGYPMMLIGFAGILLAFTLFTEVSSLLQTACIWNEWRQLTFHRPSRLNWRNLGRLLNSLIFSQAS